MKRKCCVISCDREATVGMGTSALCDDHWEKTWKRIMSRGVVNEK